MALKKSLGTVIHDDASLSPYEKKGTGEVNKYTKMIAKDPGNSILFLNRGIFYHDLGLYDKAIKDFTSAIALEPSNPRYYSERSVSYSWKGDYESAIVDAEEAAKLATGSDQARYKAIAHDLKGSHLCNQRDYQAAIVEHTQAILYDPQQACYYRNRGVAYSSLEDHKSAAADCDSAARLATTVESRDEYLATACRFRAFAFESAGRFDLAVVEMNRAIEMHPSAVCFKARADVYEDMHDLDRAILDYTRSLELDSADRITYNNRGYCFLQKRDYESAISDFNQSIRIDPTYANPHKHRGVAYLQQDQVEKGLADLNLAIQFNPKYGAAFLERGQLFSKQGEWDKAVADLERASKDLKTAADVSKCAALLAECKKQLEKADPTRLPAPTLPIAIAAQESSETSSKSLAATVSEVAASSTATSAAV